MTRDVWTIDPATARNLVASFGSTHAAADALTDATDAERTALIDAADAPLQARLEHERFQSWAASAGHEERDEHGRAWLVCAHDGCARQPLDAHGAPMKSPLVRWWCDIHKTNEPEETWRPPFAPSAFGIVDIEAEAFAAAQAQRDERRTRAQRESERAEREARLAELPPDVDPMLPDNLR